MILQIVGIDLSASVFDEEKLDWCEEIDLKFYKIASRTVKEDVKLCNKIIDIKKETIISLGMYNWKKDFPLKEKISNIYIVYQITQLS